MAAAVAEHLKRRTPVQSDSFSRLLETAAAAAADEAAWPQLPQHLASCSEDAVANVVVVAAGNPSVVASVVVVVASVVASAAAAAALPETWLPTY
jgi:hypothetical protein